MKRKIKLNQKTYFYIKNFFYKPNYKNSFVNYFNYSVFKYKDIKYIKKQNYFNLFYIFNDFLKNNNNKNILKKKIKLANFSQVFNYLSLFSLKKQFFFKNINLFLFFSKFFFKNYFFNKKQYNFKNYFFFFLISKNNCSTIQKINQFLNDQNEITSKNIIIYKNKTLNKKTDFKILKTNFEFFIYLNNLKELYTLIFLLFLNKKI